MSRNRILACLSGALLFASIFLHGWAGIAFAIPAMLCSGYLLFVLIKRGVR